MINVRFACGAGLLVSIALLTGCKTNAASKPSTATTKEPSTEKSQETSAPPGVPNMAPMQIQYGAAPAYKPGDIIPFTLKYNFDKKGELLPDGKFVEEKGWTPSDFFGTATVHTNGNVAIMDTGRDMTGIRWTGPLRKMNYEVTLEAMRVDGSDFFCGLTFPYNENPCSLIVGGWGGRLVGISSFNDMDASENGSATWQDFENNHWYRIRLRITPAKIEAWIDDKKLIDEPTKDRKIGIRWEVDKSRPFGIATWETTGAVRNIEVRGFPPEIP